VKAQQGFLQRYNAQAAATSEQIIYSCQTGGLLAERAEGQHLLGDQWDDERDRQLPT
jgi:hypothetical protein